MTKFVFILFAFIAPFSSIKSQDVINQTDAKGYKQGKWINKYPGGTIRYEGSFVDDRPVGEWKRFHENGKLKAHLFHVPNTDKVAAELYDSEGILYAKGNYIKTVKDSTWKYFNKQKLVGQEDFSLGLRNGRSMTYFEDGKPASESVWVNGELNGVSRSFFPSGSKKTEIMYRNGKRNGASLVYYESGIQEIVGFYIDDNADGTWKFQDENSNLKYELKYKTGVLLNPEVVDSLQDKEFKTFDRAKGLLKDPADYIGNPEEYMRQK